MPDHKTDPRIRRTRRQLQESLLKVGAVKPFATITVADIVAQAEVSRSTFYDHYPDVETLLLTTLEAGVENERDQERDVDVADLKVPSVIYIFLRHIERNSTLYRSALGDQGSTTVLHALRHRIESDLQPSLSSLWPDGHLPEGVEAAALSGLIIGITLYWLELEPRPGAESPAGWIWSAVRRAD